MLIAILPLLVLFAGVLVYVLASGKVEEIGRGLFWCGLLVTLFVLSHYTVQVGGAGVAILPLLVLFAGVLIYALAVKTKLVEIGKAMFWCGLLVTLFAVAHYTVRIGGGV